MSAIIHHFQAVTQRADVQGQDRVSLGKEKGEVQLQRGSRFKLVRWIRDRGFDLSAHKRAQNRSAVDAFIGALKAGYGDRTVQGTDVFKQLEMLRRGSKPLRVRHVKTALDQVVQAKKAENKNRQEVRQAEVDARLKPDYMDNLVNKKIAGLCERLTMKGPEGAETLAAEIRDKGVDTKTAHQNFVDRQRGSGVADNEMWGRSDESADEHADLADKQADLAVQRTCRDFFLTGYGFGTAEEGLPPSSDRLQKLLGKHFPQGANAVVPEGLIDELYTVLGIELNDLLDNPDRLPMDAGTTVKDKIMREVDKLAEQTVQKFVIRS